MLQAGAKLATAHAAMLLVHGRGASAADIMTVGQELMHPDFAYLAPQAAGNAWYPNPFTAPIESNRSTAILSGDQCHQTVGDRGALLREPPKSALVMGPRSRKMSST